MGDDRRAEQSEKAWIILCQWVGMRSWDDFYALRQPASEARAWLRGDDRYRNACSSRHMRRWGD